MDPALGAWLTVIVLCRMVPACLTELARTACVILIERSRRATLVAVVQAVPEGSIALEERPGGGKILVVRSQPVCGAARTLGL
ncbi:MAG: hypothetical protein JO345_32995 [Streptosporangiaceae bacterium]|nr:hypothetical protein [Streptosporangiaceae bacterium]